MIALAGSLLFPHERAGEALHTLASVARLAPEARELGSPTAELESWLLHAASYLGLELECVQARYADVGAMLQKSAPALVQMNPQGDVLAVLSATRQHVQVLAPSGEERRVRLSEVRDALIAPYALEVMPQLEQLADLTRLRGARRTKALDTLTAARLRHTSIGGVFALRLSPHASLRQHAGSVRLGRRLVLVVAAHALAHALGLSAWWAIGEGALAGRLDAGFLQAWAVLLVAAGLMRCLSQLGASGVAIDAGALLKQRLIAGALRMPASGLEARGVGACLGRVFEASTVEHFASEGGFFALFATVEVVAACLVLLNGIGGLLHFTLFVATLAISAWMSRRHFAQRRAWTERRLSLTHDLVEVMLGQATRLAQQPLVLRHVREDHALRAYFTIARDMDRGAVALKSLLPRGWMVLGILGLFPAMLTRATSPTALALGFGGVLLGMFAIRSVTDAITRLADAAHSFASMEPLLRAGSIREAVAAPNLTFSPASPVAPVATLREVIVRHAGRPTAVLDGCNLTIERGARVRIEGVAGAGKSTLAAVLSGMRPPDAGLVLAGGLDHPSLGDAGFRRRVALAPQFHDNHLFSGPLAFNLLIGRRWPPRQQDLDDAEAMCRELALGDLLDRMPSGLLEMVGETGWQLSHGEKSRVYLARTLLQRAELVVLDESFAALDPSTLQTVMSCVHKHAQAAIVIAHP